MKAPEKIYIDDFGSELSFDWHTEHCYEKDIEYIRTDAFIEDAWNWIEDNLLSSNQQDKSLLYYEQFKKYLEK